MTLIATRPDSGAARPYSFPDDRQRATVGGGQVVAAHMPGQLLATASLLLDAGARPGGRRAARAPRRCWPSALEEGTRLADSAAFALALEGLGAELSTSVDWDAFRVGVSVPVGLLPGAVGLLAEAARTPKLDPADVARVRDDEVTALRMDWAQPGPRADAALRADLFGAAERYGRPLHGDPASVAAVTVDDVRRVPRDLAAAARRAAGRRRPGRSSTWTRWARPRSPAPPASRWPPAGPLGVPIRGRAAGCILVDRPGSVQSTLRLGHRAPERAHPDYVADDAGRDGAGRRVHVPAQPPDPRGEGLHVRHPRRLRDDPPVRPVRGQRRRCRPR